MDSVTVSWARPLPGTRRAGRMEGGPNWRTAEYLCDGIDDHVEILAAISTVPGGTVVLDDGEYVVDWGELSAGFAALPDVRLSGMNVLLTSQ